MTARTRVEAHDRRIHRALLAAWWSNLAVWVALLVLLFGSLGLAYVPLGAWNFPIGIAIAGIKVSLVAYVFMSLRKAAPLTLLVGGAGLLFVSVLFCFSLNDLFSRI